MKKFLAIGISITFIMLGFSSLFIVDASRLQYHYYFIEQQKKREHITEEEPEKNVRSFSERIRPYNLARRKPETKKEPNLNTFATVPNLRYSQKNTRTTYTETNVEQVLRARRPNTLRWKNEVKRATTRHRNTGGDIRAMETYENDHFSIQVPLSWEPIEGVSHLFKSKKNKDFTISVEKVTDNCDAVSFTTCAIALSKTRNSGEGYLVISKINREGRKSYTVLSSDLMTPTFTESFFVTKTGQNETFINRFFVEDRNGGVFLVETKTAAYRAFDFIGTSKRVFDSFRFFQS